ncbi:hypothetical protein [Sphaerisporangium corydalis]|uniref:Aminoglycoside phosphotransferase domain-containing protein n=1 Tax=Sphaerisporangium corydalis TaxID=1441875 RepID=A0ABV9EBA9_9ACTN|nr:hypothetical protein [Sphaerisporangium corydalis]
MGNRSGNGWGELPADVLAALDNWCDSHDADITLVRWLEGGLSGSPVGVLRWFERGSDDRQLIIKFLPDGPQEARLTKRALNLSPDEFRRSHLVEPVGDPVPVGRWWMLRQHIAGGDLFTMRPLAAFLDEDDTAVICRVITESVLREWNPRAERPARVLTARQYIREQLGAKLAPQGGLSLWADANALTPDEDWVHSDAFSWLPNPLAFTADRSFKGADKEFYIQRGCAHGDLNTGNVLLRRGRLEEFRLIDLGRFSDDAPLARDPMHLLLAMARRWVEQVKPHSSNRSALIRAIVTPEEAGSTAVTGYGAVSQAVHEVGQSWADGKGCGDQWRIESLLSLVGGGLLFAGRHEVADDREWFFELAAYAGQEYLRVVGLLGTQSPPPLRATIEPEPAEPVAGDPGNGRPSPAPVGIPRDRALISRALDVQLVYMQRVLGNKNNLVEIVMRLFEEDEAFIRLAPCRLSGSTPGSAIIALGDQRIYIVDLDAMDRFSSKTAIAYRDILDIVLYNDRRLGLLNTADIGLSATSGDFLVRGLLRWQAEAIVSELEALTGRRRRRS